MEEIDQGTKIAIQFVLVCHIISIRYALAYAWGFYVYHTHLKHDWGGTMTVFYNPAHIETIGDIFFWIYTSIFRIAGLILTFIPIVNCYWMVGEYKEYCGWSEWLNKQARNGKKLLNNFLNIKIRRIKKY